MVPIILSKASLSRLGLSCSSANDSPIPNEERRGLGRFRMVSSTRRPRLLGTGKGDPDG